MKNNSKLIAIVFTATLCVGIGLQIASNDDIQNFPKTTTKTGSWWRPWTKIAQAAHWARSHTSEKIRNQLKEKYPGAIERLEAVDKKLEIIPGWRYLPYEAKVSIVGTIMGTIGYIGYQKGKQLYGKYTQPKLAVIPPEKSLIKSNIATVQQPTSKKTLIVDGIKILGINPENMKIQYQEDGKKIANWVKGKLPQNEDPEAHQSFSNEIVQMAQTKMKNMFEEKSKRYEHHVKKANKKYVELLALIDVVEKVYPQTAEFLREDMSRYIKKVRELKEKDKGKLSWHR